MLISMIFAWLTIFFCLIAGLKWIVRKSGNKSLNKLFHKIHIPCGIIAMGCGLIHGIFAGNPAFSTLSDYNIAPILFTVNIGSITFLCIILLAINFLLRKKLKRIWMIIHRILTIALLALVIFHLMDVGIQLPNRVAEGFFTDIEPAKQGNELNDNDDRLSVSENDQSDHSESEDAESEKQETTQIVEFSGATLKDGSYSGSAEGYNGMIYLTVTVSDGKVTDIAIDDNSDTPKFFDRAVSITDEIMNEQSLEVDAVSGATYSSVGIINAVADALSSAVLEGELKINDVDLSRITRGRRH